MFVVFNTDYHFDTHIPRVYGLTLPSHHWFHIHHSACSHALHCSTACHHNHSHTAYIHIHVNDCPGFDILDALGVHVSITGT